MAFSQDKVVTTCVLKYRNIAESSVFQKHSSFFYLLCCFYRLTKFFQNLSIMNELKYYDELSILLPIPWKTSTASFSSLKREREIATYLRFSYEIHLN